MKLPDRESYQSQVTFRAAGAKETPTRRVTVGTDVNARPSAETHARRIAPDTQMAWPRRRHRQSLVKTIVKIASTEGNSFGAKTSLAAIVAGSLAVSFPHQAWDIANTFGSLKDDAVHTIVSCSPANANDRDFTQHSVPMTLKDGTAITLTSGVKRA